MCCIHYGTTTTTQQQKAFSLTHMFTHTSYKSDTVHTPNRLIRDEEEDLEGEEMTFNDNNKKK